MLTMSGGAPLGCGIRHGDITCIMDMTGGTKMGAEEPFAPPGRDMRDGCGGLGDASAVGAEAS